MGQPVKLCWEMWDPQPVNPNSLTPGKEALPSPVTAGPPFLWDAPCIARLHGLFRLDWGFQVFS